MRMTNTSTITGRKLIFTGKGQVECIPCEVPSPAAGEVLVRKVRTLMSTGTENIVFNQNFDPGTHWDRWAKYPFHPGYCVVGVVQEIGPAADSSNGAGGGHAGRQLKVGDRIVCRNPHSSHGVLKAEDCYPVPDNVSDDDAPWFALAKISGHGVRAADIRLGDPVAVIGAGPIGQMACRWALMGGAGRVAMIDLSPERLNMAAAAGAIPVAVPAAEAKDAVLNALGGEAPRAVIDSTGNAAVLHAAFAMVETLGTVVLLGDTGSPASQTLTPDVIRRGLTLRGAHDGRNSPEWNNRIAADRFFAAVGSGHFSLAGLNTHRFRPEQCVEAYRLANTDRVRTMGILFDWSES